MINPACNPPFLDLHDRAFNNILDVAWPRGRSVPRVWYKHDALPGAKDIHDPTAVMSNCVATLAVLKGLSVAARGSYGVSVAARGSYGVSVATKNTAGRRTGSRRASTSTRRVRCGSSSSITRRKFGILTLSSSIRWAGRGRTYGTAWPRIRLGGLSRSRV